MKRSLCLLVLAIASLAVGHAQMAQQPGLPFEINNPRLDTNLATEEVYFHFTLRNPTKTPLKEITLGVVTWDSTNRPKAFQVSRFEVSVPPGGNEEVTLPMSSLLRIEPSTAVKFRAAVAQARGEAEGWRATLSPERFAAALKGAGQIPVESAPLSSLVQENGCTGISSQCRFNARCFCGQQVRCLKSFGLNGSVCSCAFECNTASVDCAPPNSCP